jgi:hypothetical protein
MPNRVKKLHPALKYGAYSVAGLLPGEDRAAFDKLRRDLISELRPEGPLERDLVENIARLTWRKQNLETVRIAESARRRAAAIWSKIVPSAAPPYPQLGTDHNWEPPDPAEVKAATEVAVTQAREELGEKYVFVEMEEAITLDQTFEHFEAQSRFDAMIEKLLKQLLFLRGLKSVQGAGASDALPRIPGPRKVA